VDESSDNRENCDYHKKGTIQVEESFEIEIQALIVINISNSPFHEREDKYSSHEEKQETKKYE